jgi:hypothetical protein
MPPYARTDACAENVNYDEEVDSLAEVEQITEQATALSAPTVISSIVVIVIPTRWRVSALLVSALGRISTLRRIAPLRRNTLRIATLCRRHIAAWFGCAR